jgi:lipoprotein
MGSILCRMGSQPALWYACASPPVVHKMNNRDFSQRRGKSLSSAGEKVEK